MKTIGMVGGTSWVSTLEYYRLLNQEIQRRLGGVESARCVLYSINFADLTRLKDQDPEQRSVYPLVRDAAERVAVAGADCLVICANTLHMFAAELARDVALPLVHIGAATAGEIRGAGLHTVGLLGTRPTMERDFYRRALADAGIAMLVPGDADREFIDAAILGEMVRGVFRPEVKQRFLSIMQELAGHGAQGIVMGCTEIPLLIDNEDTGIRLFDTLAIHVRAAVDFALAP